MQAHEESMVSQINALQDTQRNLYIGLASGEVACDERVKDAIVQEVETIE